MYNLVLLNPHDNDYMGVILFISWRVKWSKREFINIMKRKGGKGYRVFILCGKVYKSWEKEKAKTVCLDAPHNIVNQTGLNLCV